MALLKQLGELRDAGVVTNEEFEAKKKDLLDRL
ncbi:SHOCT domain-containing protein [Actinomadura sp. BRA 177]|nr:SHOCT domain-containing protein [Actinomadura sp. BRA 177]